MQLQLGARLAELPYRIRPPHREDALTWPVSAADLARVSIVWPTTYEFPAYKDISETIREALKRTGVMRSGNTPQTRSGGVILHCMVDGIKHLVMLDISDYHDDINQAALSECSLYFKAHFREAGYGGDPRILPAGYFATGWVYYRLYMPYRRMYADRRELDVLARFGFKFHGAVRRRAIDALTAATDIRFKGTDKVRYSQFMREAASAKLCLQMPGNGLMTHRVAEFLGIGSCMLSQRIPITMPEPLVAGQHYVEIAPDMSDLLEKCRYYMAHDDERTRIATAASRYFDSFLHADQLVAYYLRTIIDRLGTPPRT